MLNSEYKFVSENCANLMRNAIEQFFESENKDRKRSRPITIFTRMKKILDPAWLEYSKIVDTSTPFDQLIRGFSPSEYAKEFGFLALEDWCIHTISSIDDRVFTPENSSLLELKDTIIELRSISIHFRLNKSKFRSISKNNRCRNFNIQNSPLICQHCGAPTELRVFSETEAMWSSDEFVIRRPSKKFCAKHRSIRLNCNRLNSTYQRNHRQMKAIEKEYAYLHRQAHSWHKHKAQTGNPILDEFYRLAAKSNFLFPDDESEIQRIAFAIVNRRISEKKKKIIVLTRHGETQSSIAKLLGTSQQAISKAILKIPAEFRFDL